jgi:hypothetical protein
MIKFTIDIYTFLVHVGEKPETFDRWIDRSVFTDLAGLKDRGTSIYMGIEETDKLDMMVVAFNTQPIDDTFFHPQLFFVPETKTLFVGAGIKAMTFSLKEKVKISERSLAAGFWYWANHDKFIILVEELEIAVYDHKGHFIWEERAEPPWSYGLEDNILILDIMGNISKHKLDSGSPIN